MTMGAQTCQANFVSWFHHPSGAMGDVPLETSTETDDRKPALFEKPPFFVQGFTAGPCERLPEGKTNHPFDFFLLSKNRLCPSIVHGHRLCNETSLPCKTEDGL